MVDPRAVAQTLKADFALAGITLDLQESLYRWASRRVHDTLPVVPLFNGSSSLARRYDVAGVAPSPVAIESYGSAEVVPEGSTTVTPDAGGSVGYRQGATFTSLRIPPEAVPQAIVVYISATDVSEIPADLAYAGHAFHVETGQGDLLLAGLPLIKPATVTVEYTNEDVLRIREDSLALYAWDGEHWNPAVNTCTPLPTQCSTS